MGVARSEWAALRRIKEEAQALVDKAILLIQQDRTDEARKLLLAVVEDDAIEQAEAARILGLSLRTLQNWVQHGDDGPPYIKYGGRRGAIRYSRREVLLYKESRTVRPRKRS